MTASNLISLSFALVLIAPFILFWLIWRDEDDNHWDK
jgi:hypothetical protein